MSNAQGLLRSRFDLTPGTARLAVGDVLVLVGFLVIGELSHGISPIASPLVVADTIAPFFVGWAVASLAVGAYRSDATRSVRRAVLLAAATWIPAAAIGLALRATEYFHGDSPITFALVVTSIGLLFFTAWRVAVASLR